MSKWSWKKNMMVVAIPSRKEVCEAMNNICQIQLLLRWGQSECGGILHPPPPFPLQKKKTPFPHLPRKNENLCNRVHLWSKLQCTANFHNSTLQFLPCKNDSCALTMSHLLKLATLDTSQPKTPWLEETVKNYVPLKWLSMSLVQPPKKKTVKCLKNADQ